jgi:hypothetical protein
VRKSTLLLAAIEAEQTKVKDFALSLSLTALQRNMCQLSPYHYVRCAALWGTINDASEWASCTVAGRRGCLSLSSIFGNDKFHQAVAGLKRWANIIRPTCQLPAGKPVVSDSVDGRSAGGSNLMLLGLDGTKDSARVVCNVGARSMFLPIFLHQTALGISNVGRFAA